MSLFFVHYIHPLPSLYCNQFFKCIIVSTHYYRISLFITAAFCTFFYYCSPPDMNTLIRHRVTLSACNVHNTICSFNHNHHPLSMTSSLWLESIFRFFNMGSIQRRGMNGWNTARKMYEEASGAPPTLLRDRPANRPGRFKCFLPL